MGLSPTPTRGLTLAPAFIRLALGITFIWAGWGKLAGQVPVHPEDAAILANLGIIPQPGPPAPAAPADAPTRPLPSPQSSLGASGLLPTLAQAGVPTPVAPVSAPSRTFTAADFPSDVTTRRVWGLAAKIYKAGHPATTKDNRIPSPTWPPFLSEGPFPRFLALAVAITELVGGILVLVGWLTRLAALALAGSMLGAIWLDQIGPNWQTGNVVLGFLPAYDPYDPRLWSVLLWQFSLLCGALALAVGGSGRAAIDWAMRPIASSTTTQKPAPARSREGKTA